jgi:hypothetical protein
MGDLSMAAGRAKTRVSLEGVIMSKKRLERLMPRLVSSSFRSRCAPFPELTTQLQPFNAGRLVAFTRIPNESWYSGMLVTGLDNIRPGTVHFLYYLVSMLNSIRRYGWQDLGIRRRGLRLFTPVQF